MSKFSLLRCDLCIRPNTVKQIHSMSRLKKKQQQRCRLLTVYVAPIHGLKIQIINRGYNLLHTVPKVTVE